MHANQSVDILQTRTNGHWLVFGCANLVLVTFLSLTTWYVIADPVTAAWDVYPMPFNAFIFWALMFIVLAGFVGEFSGFNRLRQPYRGLAIAIATVVFGLFATWGLGGGLGGLYPDFAADRPAGAGYFAGALLVLFGFIVYVMAVLNWKSWPWKNRGLTQPLLGIAQMTTLAVPTLMLYLIFGLPAISLSAENILLPLDTVLGLFYSVVVSIILTGQTLDNWPWKLVGEHRPLRLVVIATLGNIIVGTFFYFGLIALTKILLGANAVAELGGAITQFPAQLGVCWVFWMILWANAFENRPFTQPKGRHLAWRFVISLVLGVVSFVFYYRFAAAWVLHEPAVVGALHGNALGFMDWMILWTLVYVVGFESFGLNRLRPAELPLAEAGDVAKTGGPS